MTEPTKAAGRALAIENRAIATLTLNPRNARKHSKRQIEEITESIKTFGFTNPLLIDDDGMILAGHGRYAAAKLMGLDTVPAIKIDELSEAEKRAYVLADNKLAECAGWDRKMLAVELGELVVMLPKLSLSLERTGFALKEADTILTGASRKKAASLDHEVGPLPDIPVSLPGDHI
jgi:ParB-like chromosome segregation protein Spo0J